MRGSFLAAFCLAGSLLVGQPGLANAQSSAQPQAPGAAAPAPDLSDQKLDKVAAALETVARLEQDYRQQIETAPTTDRQRILDEAQSTMTKAVTDQGLSVEEYGSIIQVAANDPELRQKILRRLPSAK